MIETGYDYKNSITAMIITIDAPVILNIPPISIGASWYRFKLDFFTDKQLTQPMLLRGKPVQSQIHYPGTDNRFDVQVIYAGDNQLRFQLDPVVTSQLTPGIVNWDVFAELAEGVDVIAIGSILVYKRATR